MNGNEARTIANIIQLESGVCCGCSTDRTNIGERLKRNFSQFDWERLFENAYQSIESGKLER